MLRILSDTGTFFLFYPHILASAWHQLTKKRPTPRAPDVWDSAAFSGIFLASSFSCSQALSTPAHTQVTQAVSVPCRAKPLGLF